MELSMLSNQDIEKLNFTIKSHHAIYIIEQRTIGAFRGYTKYSEKILKYTNRVKKDFMLSELSLGGEWAIADKSTAKQIIIEIIKSSLVYNTSLISEIEANKIANKFLSDYNEESIYLTNGLLDRDNKIHNNLEFNIILPYTNELSAEKNGIGYLFSSAIIVFDNNKIGIFCKCESD
jgi:hypothetical protein